MNRKHENDPGDIGLSREIRESNERYDKLKNRIEQTLIKSRENQSSIRPIVPIVEEFRDELALHFALEVASESMKDAVAKAPRLTHQADELLAEQESLYGEACEIADVLQRLSDQDRRKIPQSVIDRWNDFNLRLRHHDAAERDLVLEAWYLDLGTGG